MIQWLSTNFNNCFPAHEPTFIRGVSRTTIDFIFAHRDLASRITGRQQQFMPPEWTDHVMLMYKSTNATN